jgi:hypothetical protein
MAGQNGKGLVHIFLAQRQFRDALLEKLDTTFIAWPSAVKTKIREACSSHETLRGLGTLAFASSHISMITTSISA